MGGLLRSHGVRTAGQQAALFGARERRRGLYEPSLDLYRTHRLTVAQGAIVTGTAFPVRSQPLTVALIVNRSSPASNGLLFEFGDTNRGFAAAIDTSTLIVAAGGNAAGSDGVTLSIPNALIEAGVKFHNHVTIAIIPGRGAVRVWVNGKLLGKGSSVSGSFGGDWAAASDGAIANVAGTVLDRIPAGQRVALANASVVGDLFAYDKQRPRHFQ